MSKFDEFDLDVKSIPLSVGGNGNSPQSGTTSPIIISTVTQCPTYTSSCNEVSVTTPCGSSNPLARC